jgi:hypothetical protein
MPTRSFPPPDCKADFPLRRLAADYVPKNAADARAYLRWLDQGHIDGWDRPGEAEVMARIRTPRRRSLRRVLDQARKLGADVTIATDGAVTLRFGERSDLGTLPNSTDNEWDSVQ